MTAVTAVGDPQFVRLRHGGRRSWDLIVTECTVDEEGASLLGATGSWMVGHGPPTGGWAAGQES